MKTISSLSVSDVRIVCGLRSLDLKIVGRIMAVAGSLTAEHTTQSVERSGAKVQAPRRTVG